MRPSILFLCTGNSCRSQMAEGWAKSLYADRFDFYSAGTAPQGVNPLAVKVMAEVGIDLSAHYSKTVDDLGVQQFDLIITVCDRAAENCPVLPGARIIQRSFQDPPAMARDLLEQQAILNCYRVVRDQIKDYLQSLPAELSRPSL